MAADQTAIANLALGYLGQTPIVNIDDETKNARAAKRAFVPCRDALLREYPTFNFADETVQRSASAVDANVYRWAYRALLPVDCIAVRDVNRLSPEQWERRGRYLYTNQAPPLYLRYARRIDDTTLFDPLFDEALATKIAEAIAVSVTGKPSEATRMAQRLDDLMPKAKKSDARESRAGERPPTSWELARRGQWRPPYGRAY